MLKPFCTFKGLSMGLPHFWKHGYFKENGYELGIVIGGNNVVPSKKGNKQLCPQPNILIIYVLVKYKTKSKPNQTKRNQKSEYFRYVCDVLLYRK